MHTIVRFGFKHLGDALHQLLHKRPTLPGTFGCKFATTVFGIAIQQINPVIHIQSKRGELMQTVGLDEYSVHFLVIFRLVKVVRTWAAVVVNVERFIAFGGRCIFSLTYLTGIKHACRSVHISLQFVFDRLRLRPCRSRYDYYYHYDYSKHILTFLDCRWQRYKKYFTPPNILMTFILFDRHLLYYDNTKILDKLKNYFTRPFA